MYLTLFWFSLALIVYTYVGYPFLIIVLAKLFPKPVDKGDYEPQISILIAAYNEKDIIQAKIATCQELDYPPEKLEILIGSDASDDGMDEVVESYADSNVKLVRLSIRQGKVTVLNQLAAQASGEILFFTDARQKLARQSLKLMVRHFADPRIGSVSGELMLVGDESGSYGEGVGFYWKYEKTLRKAESRFGSMLGATGAIYTLRRNLFVPAPADSLLDDMYYPLQAVAQGYRAIFVEDAKAFDQVSASPSGEMRRKIRTLAGNFQILKQIPQLFIPGKSPIAWQLISHKMFRVIVPYFLVLIILANLFIAGWFYQAFLAGQILFYLLAVLGYLVQNPGFHSRLLSLPLTFCTLNIAAVLGAGRYYFGQQNVKWE